MPLIEEISAFERLNLKNVYCCVLVKGKNSDGVPVYAYFGIFLDMVEEIAEHVKSGRPFNPKDYRAIVLARSTGEPSPEIREFMRRKFSFSEENVILEITPGKAQ
jgi:hypothetical protein